MVRLLTGMEAEMRLQVMIPREFLLAYLTFEWFLARMRPFVILENVFVAETSVADGAGEACVGFLRLAPLRSTASRAGIATSAAVPVPIADVADLRPVTTTAI